MRVLCFLIVLAALTVPVAGASAVEKDASLLIGRGDEAWKKRGTAGAIENTVAADCYLSAVEAAPYSYEAHWKAARSLWWMADQELLSSGDKNRQRDLSKRAMDLAARAGLISPGGVEGHLYWALSALHYCYGVGMVGALKQGIQEEAARNLLFCYDKDRTAEGGLVLLGLSALYRTAPRPIRDMAKTVEYAREAESACPGGVRAAVYLGAALAAAGYYEESMEILAGVSEMDGNEALEPDCGWWKRFARSCVERGNIPDPDRLL